MRKARRRRRSFGAIRRLPSGRYQASYMGLDLVRHTAPTTFHASEDAEEWLDFRRKIRGTPEREPVAASMLASTRPLPDGVVALDVRGVRVNLRNSMPARDFANLLRTIADAYEREAR